MQPIESRDLSTEKQLTLRTSYSFSTDKRASQSEHDFWKAHEIFFGSGAGMSMPNSFSKLEVEKPIQFIDVQSLIDCILGTFTLTEEQINCLKTILDDQSSLDIFHRFLTQILEVRDQNLIQLVKDEYPNLLNTNIAFSECIVALSQKFFNKKIADDKRAFFKEICVLIAERAHFTNTQSLSDPVVLAIYGLQSLPVKGSKVWRNMWRADTDFSVHGWYVKALACRGYNKSQRGIMETSRWENLKGPLLPNGDRIFFEGDYVIGYENPVEEILETTIHLNITPLFNNRLPSFELVENIITFIIDYMNINRKKIKEHLPELTNRLHSSVDREKVVHLAEEFKQKLDLNSLKALFCIGQSKLLKQVEFECVKDGTGKLLDEILNIAINDIETMLCESLDHDEKNCLRILFNDYKARQLFDQFFIKAVAALKINTKIQYADSISKIKGDAPHNLDLLASQQDLISYVDDRGFEDVQWEILKKIINQIVQKTFGFFYVWKENILDLKKPKSLIA